MVWLELVYDLIFVAGIIQLGDFGLFAMHFAPLGVAWTGFTFYANRFNVDDVLHRILVILNMFALGALAIASRSALAGEPAAFALAYSASVVFLGAMYVRTWREVPEVREYCADGTYGQTIYSRKIYNTAQLRLHHRYVDVMGQLPDGRLVIDLTKFHDTKPVATG